MLTNNLVYNTTCVHLKVLKETTFELSFVLLSTIGSQVGNFILDSAVGSDMRRSREEDRSSGPRFGKTQYLKVFIGKKQLYPFPCKQLDLPWKKLDPHPGIQVNYSFL